MGTRGYEIDLIIDMVAVDAFFYTSLTLQSQNYYIQNKTQHHPIILYSVQLAQNKNAHYVYTSPFDIPIQERAEADRYCSQPELYSEVSYFVTSSQDMEAPN